MGSGFGMTIIKSLVLAGLAALAAGCSSPGDKFVNDPYEETNRSIHAFNKGLDRAVLRPVAIGYETVTPTLVQHLVGNALDTLSLPRHFVNNLLQGDPEAALETAGRFGLNIVLGLGVLDPATSFGLPSEPTDFGVTLASYGVGEGAYVELPFLGPSTARDAVGRLADVFLDPVSYALSGVAVGDYLFVRVPIQVVDARARNKSAIDQVLYESEDSYVASQSAYLQIRRRRVDGGVTADSLPDVFAE